MMGFISSTCFSDVPWVKILDWAEKKPEPQMKKRVLLFRWNLERSSYSIIRTSVVLVRQHKFKDSYPSFFQRFRTAQLVDHLNDTTTPPKNCNSNQQQPLKTWRLGGRTSLPLWLDPSRSDPAKRSVTRSHSVRISMWYVVLSSVGCAQSLTWRPRFDQQKHHGRKQILEKRWCVFVWVFPWENHWAGQELTALGLEV